MISTHINRMREELRAGELVLGTGITLSDPTVTEALAPEVDFVWIDLEHNATTTEAMLAHLIAARAGGTASIVRIPNNDVAWIKCACSTRGRKGSSCLDVIRRERRPSSSPPVAIRRWGREDSGLRRPMDYGRIEQQEYLRQANRDVFVVVQVEAVEILDDLDQVLELEGLDSLVLGPQDLSGSMGRLGETTHPEVSRP